MSNVLYSREELASAPRENLENEVLIQQDRAHRHAAFLNVAHERIRELEKELEIAKGQVWAGQCAIDQAIGTLEQGQVDILSRTVRAPAGPRLGGERRMRLGHVGEDGNYPQGNDVDRGRTDEQLREEVERRWPGASEGRHRSEPIVGYGGTDG